MKMTWQPKDELDRAGLKVTKLLQAGGYQAYWVGGIVRNMLLKIDSDNVDIATDALPDQVVLLLSKEQIYIKPIGKQFGSILAIVKGQKIEITTFRQEGFYSDNRHPDRVRFIADYLEDAKRRDFTVNAFYFDPIKNELTDPVGGMKDLKNKILRFVGDPKKRIDEDALRMLRGVRLATELNFKLEKNAYAAIKTRAKYIQGISGERIKAELDKLLKSSNANAGLKLLQEIGLLRFISPELDGLKKVFHNSKIYHLEGDGFAHALGVMDALQIPDLNLKYAALFHDSGKISTAQKVQKPEGWVNSYHGHERKSVEIFRQFAEKLHFSRLDKELICWLIEHHDDKMNFYRMDESNKIKYALAGNFEFLLDIWQADLNGNISKPSNDEYRKPRFDAIKMGHTLVEKINQSQKLIEKLAKGGLIMKYGKFKPGPEIGQRILDIKIQIVLGKIKSDSDLKKYLT